MNELLEAAREVGPEAVRHTVVGAWMGMAACAIGMLAMLVGGVVCFKLTAKLEGYDRAPIRWAYAACVTLLGLILMSVMLLYLCDLLEPVGATIKSVLHGVR